MNHPARSISSPVLTWSQIQSHYAGSWVELIDFEWSWDRPTPRWARIRHHGADRTELLALIAKATPAPESIIIKVEDLQVGSRCPVVQWPAESGLSL